MTTFVLHGDVRRGLTGKVTGSKGSLKFRNELIYRVKVASGLAKDATYWDAIATPGLPLVNKTPYRIGTKWIPYSVCVGKTAKQLKGNIDYWDVTCVFESPAIEGSEDENQPEDRPADLPSIAPKIEYQTEMIERVVWKDIHGKEILNPLGEHFAEPTMAPVALVVANLNFYTAANVTWEKLADHGGRVNNNPWNNKPAYSWLITDISRTPAVIPLSDDTDLDVLQWKYSFKHNPLPEGWRSTKILIATHYLPSAGSDVADAKEFTFNQSSNKRTGFIKLDGTKSDVAVFKEYEHIQQLNYSTEIGDIS